MFSEKKKNDKTDDQFSRISQTFRSRGPEEIC